MRLETLKEMARWVSSKQTMLKSMLKLEVLLMVNRNIKGHREKERRKVEAVKHQLLKQVYQLMRERKVRVEYLE